LHPGFEATGAGHKLTVHLWEPSLNCHVSPQSWSDP
jgi:hypothetical protein